ncbi:MAG: hypothetical protein JWL60_497 [Gemmatimonadetes bacterium]|nr:hypothetical protein [Gemmatimonadota bacterium]
MSFLDRRLPFQRLRTACLIASCLLVLSCGGGGEVTGTGGGGGGGGTVTQASSVGVSPDTATMPVGSTRQLAATARDAAGAALTGRTITWTTSSATVATVTGGMVTATGAGTATITATADGKVGTATVTVPTAVGSVAVTPVTAALLVGGTQQLAASLKDAAGTVLTGRAVTWSTSAASVATVNATTGLVTAVAAGTATITATSETRTGAATITVTAASASDGAVSAHFDESCGLTNPGVAYCWGAYMGAVQQGASNGALMPLAVAGVTFTSISTGFQHACGLTAAGAAYCWGRNTVGELGGGITTSMKTDAPVLVSGGLRFASIHAGMAYTVALTPEGKAYAWGGGGVGDGTAENRAVPTAVAGGLTFRAVSTSGNRTVGLTADGTPYFWGVQFGEPLNAVTLSPRRVEGTETLRFASVDVYQYRAIALNMAGDAYEWGGQFVPTPVRVAPGLTFVRVEAGGGSSYGVTGGGQVYAWGGNAQGQLGDGTTTDRITPVLSAGGRAFRSFAAGNQHALGVDAAGVMWAWGSNYHGQFGNGDMGVASMSTPVPGSTSDFSMQVTPGSPTLNAGQGVDLTVLVTRRWGSFTTSGTGIGKPGAVNVSISNLPTGVTSSLSQTTIPADQPGAVVRLTASTAVAGGSTSVTLTASASGFPTRIIVMPLLLVSSTGGTGLNLVCTSSTTPTSFPAGYHCMTNSANQYVPGKFDVPTLTGSPWWVEETSGVCVSWRNENNRGLSTARFKAGLGGGATTVTNGHWGLIVNPNGASPGSANAQPIFTSNLDAQTQLLSFNPTSADNVINNYGFRRSSSCPW